MNELSRTAVSICKERIKQLERKFGHVFVSMNLEVTGRNPCRLCGLAKADPVHAEKNWPIIRM